MPITYLKRGEYLSLIARAFNILYEIRLSVYTLKEPVLFDTETHEISKITFNLPENIDVRRLNNLTISITKEFKELKEVNQFIRDNMLNNTFTDAKYGHFLQTLSNSQKKEANYFI